MVSRLPPQQWSCLRELPAQTILRLQRGDILRRRNTRGVGTYEGDIHCKGTTSNVNYSKKREGTHTERGHRKIMDQGRADTHVMGTYTEKKEEI